MSCRTYRCSLIILLIAIGLIGAVYAQDNVIVLSVIQVTKLEDVSDFSLSNDNNKLLVARTNGDLYIWDINISEAALTIDASTFNAALNGISWSSDDSLIAGAFSDKGRVWSSQTGELVYEFENHPIQPIDFAKLDFATGVNGIVFSPSELLATYNYFDSTVILYDAQTFTISHELGAHQDGGIEEVLFSHDSQFLAVRQVVGGITVWDTQTGERLYRFPGEAMAFSSDGIMLATGMGRFVSDIWIWDLSSGNELYEMEAPLQLNQLRWANDNQTVYGRFGGPPLSDGWIYNGAAIRGWNIGEATYDDTFGLAENVSLPLVLEEDEVIIGIGSYQLKDEVLIWDQISREIFRHSLSNNRPDQYQTIYVQPNYTFDLDSDLGIMAVGHTEGFSLWDTFSGNLLNMISTEGRVVKVEVISYNDGIIVTVTNNHKLSIWQVDNL